MRYLILLTSFAFIFSCKTDKPTYNSKRDTSEVLIKGTIKNYSLQDSISKITVYAYDKMLNQNSINVDVDTLGNFEARLDIDHQQDINLYYKHWVTLLLSPGDSVNLSLNGAHKTKTELYNSIEISGTAEKINTTLVEFNKNDTILNSYNKRISMLEPSNYKVFHDSIFSARNAYIDSFINDNKDIDDAIKDWLYVERELQPKTSLLGFPMVYRMYNPKKGQQVDYGQDFFKSLKTIAPLSDKHLVNGNVASFGNYYLFHYYQQIRPPGTIMKPREMDSISLRQILKDNTDNKFIAQLAIGNRIKSNLESQDIRFIERELPLLKDLFEGSVFEEPIFKSYEIVKARIENQELPEHAEVLEFKSKDPKDYLAEIIENANGKVIYIDHWATWCGPCLSQFKNHTAQFKDYYKDNVEFVYLCYKSEANQWKPIITKYNLSGKHYFISREDGDVLAQQMKVDGFPTYTIINKKGEIVQSDFKYRPSEAVTKILINDLLK